MTHRQVGSRQKVAPHCHCDMYCNVYMLFLQRLQMSHVSLLFFFHFFCFLSSVLLLVHVFSICCHMFSSLENFRFSRNSTSVFCQQFLFHSSTSYFVFSLSRRLEHVVQQCCCGTAVLFVCLFVCSDQTEFVVTFLPCLVSVVSPTHSRWLKLTKPVLDIACVVTSLSACEAVRPSSQRAHSAVSHEHVKAGIVQWSFFIVE